MDSGVGGDGSPFPFPSPLPLLPFPSFSPPSPTPTPSPCTCTACTCLTCFGRIFALPAVPAFAISLLALYAIIPTSCNPHYAFRALPLACATLLHVSLYCTVAARVLPRAARHSHMPAAARCYSTPALYTRVTLLVRCYLPPADAPFALFWCFGGRRTHYYTTVPRRSSHDAGYSFAGTPLPDCSRLPRAC